MGLWTDNDLDYLEGFEYERDRKLTEYVIEELDAECWVNFPRLKLTLDLENHLVNIWYPEVDSHKWDHAWQGACSAIMDYMVYFDELNPKEWEGEWDTCLCPLCDFGEMDFGDGPRYRDPYNRQMPPVDRIWSGVSRDVLGLTPLEEQATSVAWLAYARLLVRGPLNVLDMVEHNLSDVRALLAKRARSRDAIVTFGFETIEDAWGDPLLDKVRCRFSAYDVPLLYECKLTHLAPEYVVYAPYYSIQVVQKYMSAIRADLQALVSLVPVPFVAVPPFIAAPFYRTTANLLVL